MVYLRCDNKERKLCAKDTLLSGLNESTSTDYMCTFSVFFLDDEAFCEWNISSRLKLARLYMNP